MADDFVPPNKAKIKMALDILEEEQFIEHIKQQLTTDLTALEFQTDDVGIIAQQIADYRRQAQGLDSFMDKLKEYTK